MNKGVKSVKIITAITFILVFISIIILTIQFIKIANLKEKNNALTNYKQELVSEIENYKSTNSYYDNNRTEYLENYAREVLGWGKAEEKWTTTK